MGPDSIHLSVRSEGGEGIYRFMCPVCMEDVEKQADRKIVALLVSAGVALADRTVGGGQAAPMVEEAEPLPSFNLDDAIAFHYELQDELAIERFLSEPA